MRKRVFDLKCNGKEVRTIKDFRENFFISDVLREYKEGSLEEWLYLRGYEEEYNRVKEISKKDEKKIIENLMNIFGVTGIGNSKDITEEYYCLTESLINNDGNVKNTKKIISVLIEKYLPLLEMNFNNLIYRLASENANLTILYLLMNESTRKFFQLTTFASGSHVLGYVDPIYEQSQKN